MLKTRIIQRKGKVITDDDFAVIYSPKEPPTQVKTQQLLHEGRRQEQLQIASKFAMK